MTIWKIYNIKVLSKICNQNSMLKKTSRSYLNVQLATQIILVHAKEGKYFFMDENNLMAPGTQDKFEEENEYSLRPKTLSEYIGQTKVKENMKVYIEAAKKRNEALDHVLLYGPPGLGKTTLSNIIANEMGSNIKITSGPAIEKPGDLAAILTALSENDVLFIDEIHRMNRSVEEILYPALEDYTLDIIIGKGSAIMLHCSKDEYTYGCVGISRENMIKLLGMIDSNTKIKIEG